MTVLAVDLGKTTCRVALWHAGGCGTAEGPGSPGLAEAGGVARAEAAIVTLVAGLMRAAGLSEVEAAGIGAAGAWTAPDAAQRLADRLAPRLPARRVVVASDAIAAHAGALGGQPGVVLSVGTGTVAVAVGPNGVAHRVDGLGPWLGDEGSGAAIGRAGLRAALRAAEGRGPQTKLAVSVDAQAAAFAPVVISAAEAGDPVASAILAEAAAALVATVRAARARLPEGRWPFALVGGLAGVGALTAPLLAVLDSLSLARVDTPGSALAGARWLATAQDGETLVPALSRQREREQQLLHVSDAVRPTDTLDLLATEAVRPGLEDLDQRSPAAIVALALEAERAAHDALDAAAPSLGALADAVAARLAAGGRLFYLGAGTPGRLAVLDAAELLPTFSTPPGLVVALLAGGPGAMVQAAEGAEDDAEAASAALDTYGLTAADAVVGIAASGRTPFVVGGLRHAAARGALTGAIVNNPHSPAAAASAHAVEILTGAELIAGSTRMTAGTTQKIALNALSTACMVSLGKTYGGRMVDVRASNEKLRRRALRTVCEVAGCAEDAGAAALEAVGGRVKPALVMLLAGLDASTAEQRLDAAGGRVRDAIASGVQE